jgi:hypothetical protein
MFRRTLQQLFSRKHTKKSRSRPSRPPLWNRYRLRIDLLEDRVLPSATLITDQTDYAPKSTAIFRGSGFIAGETVDLQVSRIDGGAAASTDFIPWHVLADSQGNFVTAGYVAGDLVGASLQATATGESSLLSAQATFTDGPGTIRTTDANGVDQNKFTSKNDVYVSEDNLPDGSYYVQVVAPGGGVLGTSVGSANPTPIVVSGGVSSQSIYQLSAILIKTSDGTPGYDDTTNNGGEYKVDVSASSDFSNKKSHNFKAGPDTAPFQPITISGFKFNDVDGKPSTGADDLPLSGWVIHLVGNSANVTATTDVNGFYHFDNVGAGTYTLGEDLKNGWTQTFTPSGPFTVVSALDMTDQDFGNFQNASISGRKFNDLNGSGADLPGDPGVGGVVIDLFKNGAITPFETTTTANDGTYSFTNLGPGNYTVQEEVPSGSTETFGNAGYSFSPLNSDTNSTGNDFGNFQLVTISGHKFNDMDGNPATTGDDVPLANWVIHLKTGQTDLTATTDSNGFYEFDNVGPGTYTLSEDLQSGWTQTFAPENPITLQSGQDISNEDFGNMQDATISGHKFNDTDGNPQTTGDDVPLSGWVIDLSNGETTQTATTDSNGFYQFTGLGAGTYTLTEELQTGWMQTFGPTSPVTIQSADNLTNQDFGNVKLVTISGTKFENHDGDGGRALGDEGLPGWVITLDGTTTATTDANGNYSFTGVGPGTHTVDEVLQSGWTQTKGGQGSGGAYTIVTQSGIDDSGIDFGNFHDVTISGHKFNDVDGNPATTGDDVPLANWVIHLNNGETDQTATTDANGFYHFDDVGPGSYSLSEDLQSGWKQTFAPSNPVTPQSGQDISNEDFGNFQLVTISGHKFNDVDGNPATQGDDVPLAGWVINLAGTASATATTDANGFYHFDNLGPGVYTLSEDLQTGWKQTFAPSGPIVVQSGQNVSNEDFGNFQLITISGHKFNDVDDNPGTTGDDVPLAGWVIHLAGAASATATTNASGFYHFDNLGPGTYTLSEDLQTGWVQTFAPSGPITAQSGQNVSNEDFGNFKGLTVAGMKFNDHNGNGIKDSGDEGLCGWQIMLDGNVVATTDSNGNYSIPHVTPGQHTFQEVTQAGWKETRGGPNGFTFVVSNNLSHLDFGNFKLVTISGTKFQDHDGDGGRSPIDEGLQGWQIKLDGVVAATTDSNGNYSLPGIGPGTHVVQEVQQAGWVRTKGGPVAGAYSIVAQSGVDVAGEDFGNFKLVTISGTKFEDHNGNGVRNQPTDQGLAGWVIKVDGVVKATTDANGNYTISGVGPGTHNVTELLQTGWTQTKGGGGPGGAYKVTTSSGTNVSGDDFGNFQLVTVTGTTFEDHNGSNSRDIGDQGLAGWHIRLDGQDLATTDANGQYSISGVGPGTHTVQEILQTGFTETLGAPLGYSLTTSSGTSISGKDFGDFKNVTFSGSAFEDHNGNTARDVGDQGLAGWHILLDGRDVTTTDSMGNYTISNIGQRNHTLQEVKPTGWSGTLGRTGYAFATLSGVDVTRDFGNFMNVTFNGNVFEDHNGNGNPNPGDQGLAGWHILLDGKDVTTTDANGNYSIPGVISGTHKIQEVNQAGFTITLGNAGYAFATTSGVNATRNFGDFKNFTANGLAFYDKNANGMKDSGEPGLGGWLIRIVDGNNKVLTATTASDGTYSIAGVGPGIQTLTEAPQVGFTQSSKNPAPFQAMSGMNVSGANFGNVMIGQGGGKSISFWTSASGQAIYNSADLAGLHLVQDNGSAFVPGAFSDFKKWVLNSGLSGNDAYQLSVQLALAQLNVSNNFVDPTESVFVGAIPESAHLGSLVNTNGYVNIQALLTNANNFLADSANDNTVASSPARTYEEALKLVLSGINGNYKITVLPPPP